VYQEVTLDIKFFDVVIYKHTIFNNFGNIIKTSTPTAEMLYEMAFMIYM
jgi:hypothetical protein